MNGIPRRSGVLVLIAATACAAAARADDEAPAAAPKLPEPTKQHRWLDQLAGEWTYEMEAVTDPAKPPEKAEGKESARSLGGMWLVAEGTFPGPADTTMHSIMTLGWDEGKQRFVGTWICSLMGNLWEYEGTLDESGKVLTLESTGPDMSQPGKTARYRDVIEVQGKDRRVLTSSMLGPDGAWRTFLTARYRRTAP